MKCPHCDGTGELPMSKANVGTMIMAARLGNGMTQQDLAGKVGRSRAQIANIEAGRSDIPVSLLGKFAEAFSISMRDLIP